MRVLQIKNITGIFFNEELVGRDWPIIDDKFINMPKAMNSALKLPNVQLFQSKPVSLEYLLHVHSPNIVESLKHAWYCEGALITIGGFMEAAEKVYSGELLNALNFMVAAGHHAGPHSAWGGTYASITGPAMHHLRNDCGFKGKIAIIDTDSHHGDGTRAMFMGDPEVLHACFCSSNAIEDDGSKICVNVGYSSSDEDYLEKVEREFVRRVETFQPDMIFHIMGHDTCLGDYGDRGLSMDFFPDLVKLLKKCADKNCNGKLVITTMGGARVDVTDYITPIIIEILAF